VRQILAEQQCGGQRDGRQDDGRAGGDGEAA
jgi:hypothetical protein